MTNTTCPKCLGAKILRPFMHIDNGRCFTCAGAGVIEIGEQIERKGARRSDSETIERWRLDFRTRYANIRRGVCSAQEGWDALTDPDGSGWSPDAVRESLEAIGATQAFRALGWPV